VTSRQDYIIEGDDDSTIVSSLDYSKFLDENVPDLPKVYSGMEVMDKYLEGFEEGEVYLVSGKPKHGKSLWIKSLINSFYTQGVLSIVFSYEEPPKQFFRGFEDNGKKLLFYMPKLKKTFDVDGMLNQAIEARDNYGTRVMFIDNGQFLAHRVTTSRLDAVIGDMMLQIKNFANDEGYIIFLIWHLKKEQVVSLKSLNDSLILDSAMLYALCDGLIFLYREVESTGLSTIESSYLKLHSHRRTPTYEQIIPLVKKGKYFKEIDVGDI